MRIPATSTFSKQCHIRLQSVNVTLSHSNIVSENNILESYYIGTFLLLQGYSIIHQSLKMSKPLVRASSSQENKFVNERNPAKARDTNTKSATIPFLFSLGDFALTKVKKSRWIYWSTTIGVWWRGMPDGVPGVGLTLTLDSGNPPLDLHTR